VPGALTMSPSAHAASASRRLPYPWKLGISCERVIRATKRPTVCEWSGIRRSLGSVIGMVAELDNFAQIAAASLDRERAAMLFGAAAQLRLEHEMTQSDHARSASQSTIAELRDAMGSSAFSAAWEQGVSMTTDQANDLALSIASATPTH
jgi:hypothetical protein